MGHWKRLIKISGGTDCYYCIHNMTCLIHVYYCLDVIVTVPDHLSAIMLHVYLLLCLVHVTLSVVAYYACSALHLFCIPCRHHYCICTTQYCGYIAYAHLHVHIAYAHLHVRFHHVTTRQYYLLYKLDTTHDPMITG